MFSRAKARLTAVGQRPGALWPSSPIRGWGCDLPKTLGGKP